MVLFRPLEDVLWGAAGHHFPPVLFNTYMKQLEAVTEGSGASSHHYADDTQLCFSIISESGAAVQALDWCLDAVLGLLRENKLSLNSGKTEALRMSGLMLEKFIHLLSG